jgi:hypothetical protein
MNKTQSLKCIYALLIAFPSLGVTWDANANEGFPLSKIPRMGASLRSFVPQGWHIEHSISGDLDGDGIKDVALQLLEDLPKSTDPNAFDHKRALIVLLKHKDRYERVGVSASILIGPQEGGARGASVCVKIDKGVLITSNSGGSNDGWSQLERFRFERRLNKMMLIGVDQKRDIGAAWTYTGRSTNLLTHQRIDEAGKLVDVPVGHGVFSTGYRSEKQEKHHSIMQTVALDDWNGQGLEELPEPDRNGEPPSDE